MKLAYKLQCKEILVEAQMKKQDALKGLQLEGDHTSPAGMWAQVHQHYLQKDVCEICAFELVKKGETKYKGPLKIFIKCGHTFHQYCVNINQKELDRDAHSKLHACPKCNDEKLDITVDKEIKKGVNRKIRKSQKQMAAAVESESESEPEEDTKDPSLSQIGRISYDENINKKSESLLEQYLDMFDIVSN
jgi:hypothetical protein